MIVSEDGTVTGSIDHAALAQVEPKTDEARAQIEQLRAEQLAGAAQADAEAARLAAIHAAQSPWTAPVRDNRDVQGKSLGVPDDAAGHGDQSGTQKSQDKAADPATSTNATESAKDAGAGSSSRRSTREG